MKEVSNNTNLKLIKPENDLYDQARAVWNEAVDRYPKAIAVCRTEDEVAAAIRYAKTHGYSISIKGGGHHVGGTAVCNGGLMIDLSEMKNVYVDQNNKTAQVQSGATLGDIDKETQIYGLAVPTGTVSKTGIAGLALNGGLGYLRNKFGLTCDNITAVRLVTFEGEIIQVTEKEHPDLHWAICGGGGNFGVVTQFEFTLHSVGPEVLAIDVIYSLSDAKDILLKVQQYMETFPDELTMNITAAQLPPLPFIPEPLHYQKVLMFTGMYTGAVDDGEKVIQPLRDLAEPLADQSGPIPYLELQTKLDVMVPDRVPVYGTSLYFDALDNNLIDILLKKIDEAPAPTFLVQLWELHGEANRRSSSYNAYAIRDAGFVMLADIMATDKNDEQCKLWIDKIYDVLYEFSHKGASYLNGISPSDSNIKNAFQDNLDQLVKVKKKYDPHNIFRHNHNIQ